MTCQLIVLSRTIRGRWSTVVAGIRISYLPAQASDNFAAGFTMPPGTALDATDRLARQAEQIIMADPGVAAVQATVGNGGSENSSITVRVKSSAITDAVRT